MAVFFTMASDRIRKGESLASDNSLQPTPIFPTFGLNPNFGLKQITSRPLVGKTGVGKPGAVVVGIFSPVQYTVTLQFTMSCSFLSETVYASSTYPCLLSILVFGSPL